MTKAMRRLAATTSIVLAFGAATILPAAASHGGGHEVERSGGCSSGTHWKLKAEAEDGRIEVEGEIDSDVSGQVWTWRILHNGGVSVKGARRPNLRAGRSRCDASWSTHLGPTGSESGRRTLSRSNGAPGTCRSRSRHTGCEIGADTHGEDPSTAAAPRPRGRWQAWSRTLGSSGRAVRGGRRSDRGGAVRGHDLVQPEGRDRRGHLGGP